MKICTAERVAASLGLACLLTACGGIGPNQDEAQAAFQQGLSESRGKNPGSDSYLPPDVIANLASRLQLLGCKPDPAWETATAQHVICDVHMDRSGLPPSGGENRGTLHFESTDDGWRLEDANEI